MTADGSLPWLDALFEASPVGLAILDASLRFVRINPTLAELNGVSVAEHIGRTLREILPELAPVTEPVVRHVLERGEAVRDIPLSGTTPRQLGVLRHWRASYIPLELGGARCVATYVEDITDQVTAEQALQASELRFRTICEAAPLGIFLTEGASQVVYANPAAQRMVGRPESELLREGWGAAVHPDDVASVTAIVRAADQSRRGDLQVDARFVRPDGTVVWTETVAREVYDGSRHLGRVAVMSDVTERRKIEAALHESEALFRELSENVDAVFYLSRPDVSRIDYVSRGFTTVWGRSREELQSNPDLWLTTIHPDDRARVTAAFGRDRAGFKAEYRVVRPDGSVRWVSDRSFPVRDAEGKIVRIAGVATDETERRTLEAQLLQAQRLESIGRLAGGVAHDFNNLLTVVMSHAAFARQDPKGAEEDLISIERAGRRAAELTSQLLAFARRQVIEPRVVALNALTGQVDRMLQRLLGEQVALETQLQPDLWTVRVDPAQMEQVLVNLAVNARDAMPNGGTLTIETANVELGGGYALTHADVVPGEYVMVAVSDSGEGIDPALLPMIFEPFFTTKPSGVGTGLGLATCYGIVKQAGGHIWAYSEPGRGSTFKLYLPRAEGEVADTAHAVPDPAVQGDETILLVEDDADVRAIAVRALRVQGFRVLEATDGVDALEVARAYAGTIHLLLTDVVMPRMGGKELAAVLVVERPAMRVLFASGYTRNAIVHQGVLEQGRHFLQKPYVPATLARRVREVLDG